MALRVDSVEILNPRQVLVHTQETIAGNLYGIRVEHVSSTKGILIDEEFDSKTFIGASIQPRLVPDSIEVTLTTITLTFSDEMQDGVGEYSLLRPENYVFTQGSFVSVDEVTRIGLNRVELLLLGEMETGEGNYELAVYRVKSISGATIDPLNNRVIFGGLGIAPQVLTATISTYSSVWITFNEPVGESAEIVDNYAIEGLEIESIERINPTTVNVLFTQEIIRYIDYTIEISGVKDLSNNEIDEGFNSIGFTLDLPARMLEAETIVINPRMTVAETIVIGPQILSAETITIYPQILGAETIVANPRILDAETIVIGPQMLSAETIIIGPRILSNEIVIIKPRVTGAVMLTFE